MATDVNFEKLKELQAEESAILVDALDVTKSADVAKIIKKYDDINVLFNCAG